MKRLLAIACVLFFVAGCGTWVDYKGRKGLLITIGPALYLDIDREIEAKAEVGDDDQGDEEKGDAEHREEE